MTKQANHSPQSKVCGYEYTVRRGDSFYLIANRLGIPLRDLLEANSDINPARLMVGDVLCIPTEEDDAPPEGLPPAAPESPVIPETPLPGEMPQEQLPPEAVPEADIPDLEEDLDSPAAEESRPPCPEQNRYTLRPGETAADIQLQADINRYTLQQANPSTDLERLAAGQVLCVPSFNTACPTASTYTLQPEDTLESVALRLNTSLGALLRANPCLAPSDFIQGRCILIPQ